MKIIIGIILGCVLTLGTGLVISRLHCPWGVSIFWEYEFGGNVIGYACEYNPTGYSSKILRTWQ